MTPASYRLSPMQAGILFHCLSGEDPAAYVEQVLVTLREPLDEALFARAWQQLAQRHPVLRSRLRWQGLPEPLQEVLEEVRIPVERLDWRAFGEPERRRRLEQLLSQERSRGFKLDEAPPVRVALARAGEQERWVLLTAHHAFLDGRARVMIWREVFALYEALLQGTDPGLPRPSPFRDHIDWLAGRDDACAKRYWQELLSGFRGPTPLVVARLRDAADIAPGARDTREVRLSRALTRGLKRHAREAGATLGMLLQAAWAMLLHRYSAEADIVFGVTRACRGPQASACTMGLFINTLPVRVRIEAQSDLASCLQQLRAQHIGLREHEHTPLVKVQSWSDVPRGVALFESILVFDSHTLDAELRALGGAWQERRFLGLGHVHYPLALAAYGDPELLLQLHYSRRRFDDQAVSRMLGHLCSLLEAIVADPCAPVSGLGLLPQAERHQLTETWNSTSVAYPAARSVHEMFEEQARVRPDALAVQSGARQLTYRELDRWAEGVAAQLRGRGVQPGDLVAIYFDRSIEMLAAILGVWKSGAAYVPVDPNYPAERVRFLLEDAKAVVALTREPLAAALPRSIERVEIDEKAAQSAGASGAGRAQALPQRLAYVIYTSGSTGRPKGVPIKHENLFNLICWHQRAYEVGPGDRATQIAGPAFDGAVWEVWPYLTAGASVHIPDEPTRLDAAQLVRWLSEQRITLSFLPTPLAEAALRQEWPATAALRVLLTGGDRLNLRPAPGLPFRVVNHYGPTENTVVSTCAEVAPEGAARGAPPIGRPLPNTQAYVVDRCLQPVPVGVPGELLLGGAQLSAGYWNRPDLTAEKFVADPFHPRTPARLYRTGDRVRLLPEGDIEFLGRVDDQVRIRGFRIEPGEIEAVLHQHPAVRDCAVVAREDSPGDRRLVAYVAASTRLSGLADELRTLLKRQLPDYMVPAAYVCLSRLPWTQNGKLDREALPPPERARALRKTLVTARTQREKALARVWQELLAVEKVGVHDDFFDLGGHSLLIVRLLGEINSAYGVSLNAADVFRNPTVAQLAALIDRQPGGRRQPAVIPLRTGRSGLPLYFMYAGPDELRLAGLMGDRHPVFGIEVPWPRAWRDAVAARRRGAFPTMDELVARYAAALRSHVGASPCALAGHSFGGLLAFEVAHALRKHGGKVELVMLFDAWAGLPNPYRLAWQKWRREGQSRHMAWPLARWLLAQEKHRLWSVLHRLRGGGNELTTVLDEHGMPLPWMLLERLYRNIATSYRPRPVESRGILFRTSEQPLDEQLGWSGLFRRGLEVIPVVGDHLSMIRQHTGPLAQQMNNALERHAPETQRASLPLQTPTQETLSM